MGKPRCCKIDSREAVAHELKGVAAQILHLVVLKARLPKQVKVDQSRLRKHGKFAIPLACLEPTAAVFGPCGSLQKQSACSTKASQTSWRGVTDLMLTVGTTNGEIVRN